MGDKQCIADAGRQRTRQIKLRMIHDIYLEASE